MARIRPIEGRRADPLLRLFNLVGRRMFGMEMLPPKILAHNPRFLLPYAAMNTFASGKTRLAPEIRALAMQLAGEINGCDWCVDFGQAESGKLALPPEKMAHVLSYASSPLFSARERAALAYAEAVTQVGARVPDEVFAELRRHFSEQEIVELTVAVAAENFFNRLNTPLEIEAQGFCALPAALANGARRPT